MVSKLFENTQLIVFGRYRDVTSLLQRAKQNLTHEQRLQVGGDGTVHFAGSVFRFETLFQQPFMCFGCQVQADVTASQLFIQLAQLLVEHLRSLFPGLMSWNTTEADKRLRNSGLKVFFT